MNWDGMVESRLQGVEAPTVEVRFERLTVEADVRIGHRAVPTLINCAVNAAQVINYLTNLPKKFPSPLTSCSLIKS